MAVCAAFPRAVNLAGHNANSMADLRRVCEASGLANVRTLLQSGNVVFESREAPAQLEKHLESRIHTRLGIDTNVMIRTQAQLDAVIEHNPFPTQAAADPAHLVVVFLKSPAKVTASAPLA